MRKTVIECDKCGDLVEYDEVKSDSVFVCTGDQVDSPSGRSSPVGRNLDLCAKCSRQILRKILMSKDEVRAYSEPNDYADMILHWLGEKP